jgi:hypothetical protein
MSAGAGLDVADSSERTPDEGASGPFASPAEPHWANIFLHFGRWWGMLTLPTAGETGRWPEPDPACTCRTTRLATAQKVDVDDKVRTPRRLNGFRQYLGLSASWSAILKPPDHPI